MIIRMKSMEMTTPAMAPAFLPDFVDVVLEMPGGTPTDVTSVVPEGSAV